MTGKEEHMTDVVEVMRPAIEGPIYRRAMYNQISGYTRDTAEECTRAALAALNEAGYVVVERKVLEPLSKFTDVIDRAEASFNFRSPDEREIHPGLTVGHFRAVRDAMLSAAQPAPK